MNFCAHSGRRTPALAVLALLAGSLVSTAASASIDGVRVRADFLAGTIGFTFNASPPVYILSAQLDATGFTDDSNVDNYVRIQASTFTSTWFPAAMHGSAGDGSFGYSGVADLNNAINGGGAQLTLFDGVTGQTSIYDIALHTPGFTDDHIRPVHIDNAAENTVISDSPTFTFSQAPAMDPMNANTSLFAGLLADHPANNVFSPSVMLGDTSWTPTAPLAPDRYTLLIINQNRNVDQGLISLDSPTLSSGPDTLAPGFATSLFIQNSDQREGLLVVPTPGAAALLGLGGLAAFKRRRA